MDTGVDRNENRRAMATVAAHATGALILCALAGAGCTFDQAGVDTPGANADAAAGDPIDAAAGDPIDAEPPLTPDAEPVPTAFEKTITIHGAQVSGTLVDFPVYIELTDSDLQARATAAGADLHFVDATGQASLDHEIQRWDPQLGRLEAWVRVPQLNAGVDLEVRLRYGAGADVVAPNPSGVWSNGFASVWHLEQSPAAGQDAVLDSAGSRHGTGSGSLNADDLVAASLGRGVRFEGGTDEITFSNPLPGSSAHTISAWVDQVTTGDNDALIVLGNGACGQARWFHSRFTGGAAAVGFYCDDVTGGPNLQAQGPTLVHWTYDADAESRIFRGGVLAHGPTEHAGTQSTMGTLGRIGNAPGSFGSNMGLNAVVDEVRIATVARAPEWISTEFANQSAPASFYTVGTEVTLP